MNLINTKVKEIKLWIVGRVFYFIFKGLRGNKDLSYR